MLQMHSANRVFVTAIALLAPSAAQSQSIGVSAEALGVITKGIYGEKDDRVEVFESDKSHQEAARSVAALFEHSTLSIDSAKNEWVLPSGPLLRETTSNDISWCESEPFSDQPAAAFCTGFLIAPDRLVSSAHCVKPNNGDPYAKGLECGNIAVVFDYDVESLGAIADQQRELGGQQLYNCEAVLGRYSDPSGADWSVLQLDREVYGREPLTTHGSNELAEGATLSVIGHPLGLPAKVATGATVLDQSNPTYVVTDLDTYTGNSGSPVFVKEEGTGEIQVFGVLSRGHYDAQLVSSQSGGVCAVSRECRNLSCDGEHVTRISAVPKDLILVD